MNFTNILFNLISLTNLTIFVNRLIIDGQYQTAILLYDYEAIGDTNFIQELNDSPNRNYTLVTVCLDNNTSTRILESNSYRNILNALHIVVISRAFDAYFVMHSRDTIHLFPMPDNQQKQRILRNYRSLYYYNQGNLSLIFYETPYTKTYKHGLRNQIEAFVVNSRNVQYNRRHYEIDSQRDIHFQLNQTDNLAVRIFPPVGNTSFSLFNYEKFKDVNKIGTTENVLSDRSNVYMANYIARNMKNVTTWQTFPKQNNTHPKDLTRLHYQPSNGPIYAELFITSIVDNKSAMKGRAKTFVNQEFTYMYLLTMQTPDLEGFAFRLYPHETEDYVFIIYQSGQMIMNDSKMKSTATPLLQWFIIIFLCSFVLHALRSFADGRNTFVNYLVAFIDSVAIFLGNALNTISNNRPERCFIIGFSVFGLIFKTIFTGNLFIMYQEHNDNRIRTIDQLFQLDIPIYTDVFKFTLDYRRELCKGHPMRCHLAKVEHFHAHLFEMDQMFAFLTSRSAAERYLADAKDFIPLNASAGHDLYILDETYDRLYKFYAMAPKAPEADELNVLIQRSVESGLLQFYKQMACFLQRIRNPGYGTQQDDQSDIITMDHIWIYVYGFLIANGLCVAVFLGEILYFHRKKILPCLRRGIVASLKMMRKIKNDFLHNRVWRLFGRVGVASQRLMLHSEWGLLCRGMTPIQRMMQRMRNRRNRVHPFYESN